MYKCSFCGISLSSRATKSRHQRYACKKKPIDLSNMISPHDDASGDDNETLRGTNEKLCTDNETLRNTNEKLYIDNETLRNTNEKLCIDGETLRNTNDKLNQDNGALHKVIHELNQRIEWLEIHYDKIIKNVSTKQKTTVKPTVPKQLKTKIWQNAYGTENVTGKCYCCGIVDMHITFFEAGHLISHANGGEMSEKNLRPICTGCNRGMGMKNMRDYAMVVHPLTSPLLKEKTLIEIKIRQK